MNKERFYDDSCPNLTRIVRYGVWMALSNDTRMAASLLRLHFHDCFVNGCDGSVLLDDTSTFKGEKNALPNMNSIRGFEVIDNIKAVLERVCPSVVSCTDILTLAAREAVYFAGGSYWPIPLGRRDGTTASESEANQLPSPLEPLENIIAKFTSKGLNVKDVVVLSGAHTFGFARCMMFKHRLFNFNNSGNPDPELSTSLRQNLQSMCPNQDDSNNKLAPLDAYTTNKFDNVYYRNLVNKLGLLQSDQALMQDNTTAPFVVDYSRYPYLFYRDFGASMVKLANIGILTGQNGEIRKNCRVVN
ncbi:peroxidase 10 isoform X2 [Momordica charantia]|uniref:Peroxidase n=1 Tax=Momordica charantia TaxID=3673 RepID=A0A6J1BWM4_MOMCH|nr:peroxidase 10 isoform X2 [Momordica charantia]